MATHSSVLAWRIPGMGEPGGLPSLGSHRVRHDWSDLAVVAAVVKEGAFQMALVIKKPLTNAGDIRDKGSIPGLGKYPDGGHGHPLQYACWRIPWTEEPSLAGYNPWGHKESDTGSVWLKWHWACGSCSQRKCLLPLSALKNLRFMNNKRILETTFPMSLGGRWGS